MLILDNYAIKEQIHEGERYIVYRAKQLSDQQNVIIKVCRTDQPDLADVAGLQHEYQLLKQLTLPGVIGVYNLVKYQHQLALILQDVEGISLQQYLEQGSLSLNNFLKIALQLVEILIGLHSKKIVHKDINPHNIIINPKDLNIQLIDFNIATRLSEEVTDGVLVNKLQGRLAYLSPEQTGRMNRPVDYRSDFYSLGMTFFEMLSGQLPFDSGDPLETIYKHIAQVPPLVSKINTQVPLQIARIVAKLLAKTPEERYAHASGLKADLIECQFQWQTKQYIEPFVLGQSDVYDELSISHKLYGREEQVQQLLNAFEEVVEGQTELVLVTGYSGIGKTALVKEVYKPLLQHRAYFVKGKYDQLQRTVPYSAIIEAFQELVKQLLSEPEERLSQLRRKLLNAVGSNGHIITNMLPAMTLLIGQQPEMNGGSSVESQNRFVFAFQNLTRALIEPEHPLVIFLDDLQWIDSASLQLLHILLSDPELKHLLVIGAYRDNEVLLDHPLISTLQQLRSAQVKVVEINLLPLSLPDIQRLLVDTLNSDVVKVESLAGLLMEKTLGNPFFITIFLKKLYQDSLLQFSYETSQWEWDSEEIGKQNFTDNVVELLIGRIHQLPDEVQTSLKWASCIGHVFDFKTLAIISEMPRLELVNCLSVAIEANLIVSMSGGHTVALLLEEDSLAKTLDLSSIQYRFIHDRVQQAACELTPENDRPHMHLKIGRLLREEGIVKEESDRLFEALDHFNQGLMLISDREERKQVACYNLWAGRKAKRSNAYQIAQDYLFSGLDLLKPFNWDLQHDLIFNLYHELASCHYLTAKYEDAQNIFRELLERANDLTDKLNIYKSMCEMLATLNHHQQAIELGRAALKLVNLRLPEPPRNWHIIASVLSVKWKIGGRSMSDLVLPAMKNKVYQAVTALIDQLLNSAYLINQKLFVLLICENFKLYLRYGYTEYVLNVILTYTFTLMHGLHWYTEGMAFTELYFHLKQRYGSNALEARNLFVLNASINIWRHPLEQTRDNFLKAYQLAYEAGDLIYSNYCNIFLFYHTFMLGKSLSETELAFKKQTYFGEKIKIIEHLIGVSVFLDFLLGKKQFNAQDILAEEKKLASMTSTSINFFYSSCAKVYFLFNCYEQAIYAGAKHWQYAEYGLGSFSNPEGYFYYAMALMENYTSNKALSLKPVKKIHKAFQRWAKWCPENYLHYLLLIEAEMEQVKNNLLKALSLYEQAIQQAHKQDALSIVGIAYECVARFCHRLNKSIFTKACIQSAYYAYQQWGAAGKCRLLVEHYPEYLQGLIVSPTIENTFSKTENALVNVDILSILKFTQTFSGEIQLDSLLQKLLIILLQNAGAQRIILLVKNNDQWYIEAEGTSTDQQVYLGNTRAMNESKDLPLQLLQYTQRMQEVVLLQEGHALENITSTDSYLTQVNPQSVLVVPIIYQGQLKNLLYLENRVTKDAFSPAQVQTLKLLASQMAVSLENARLYYQVTHDPLTGLANRNLLYQVFNLIIGKIQRVNSKIAILFMDLDGFKHINDTMGHEVGDKLLQYFAKHLKACLRSGDVAARLGGDEFVIMLEDVEEINQIINVADRVLELAKEPLDIQGHHILISVSIGISLYPDNGNDIQTLLKQADIALYRVKSLGKGRYQFYTRTINQQLARENKQEIELRKALQEQQFCVYYQPVCSVVDSQLVYLEALIRWQHPDQGLIKAKDFVPLAEKTGLIVQLSEWVLFQVCKQIKSWQSLGLKAPPVAVNISGLQLKKQMMSNLVKKALQETDLSPELLQLELTESIFIEQTEQIITELKNLKQLGICLTIDDFGTQYSTLSYLRRFSVSTIKIDQTFVRGIAENEEDRSLIQGIIALAHHLGLKVVAEGVETEQQLTFLKESGADAVQGYYLSHPLDSEACARLFYP